MTVPINQMLDLARGAQVNRPEWISAATATIEVEQTIVNADTTAANVTITLPDVAEATGVIYIFQNAAGANDMIIVGVGDELPAFTTGNVAAGIFAVVMSSGRGWARLL